MTIVQRRHAKKLRRETKRGKKAKKETENLKRNGEEMSEYYCLIF